MEVREPDDRPELLVKLQERKERHKQRHIVHRAGVVVLGVFLVLAGIVMSGPGVPGPGIATIIVGLAFLALEFDRAERLRPKGIHYVDAGTSGGVFGLQRGFCLMIGGEEEIVNHLDPIFATIAPGIDGAPRTPSRCAGSTASRKPHPRCSSVHCPVIARSAGESCTALPSGSRIHTAALVASTSPW